jgi:hypothetical protein
MSFISIAKFLVLKTQVKVPDVSHTSLTPSPPGTILLRPILLRIPNPGCPTFIRDVPLGTSPGVLCKRRRNLYFAGGLCQAKPRTNEEKGLVVYSTLASRLLISIRIPLEIKKAATPRSQDPDPSVVRYRCHANFGELGQGEVLRISLLRGWVNRPFGSPHVKNQRVFIAVR